MESMWTLVQIRGMQEVANDLRKDLVDLAEYRVMVSALNAIEAEVRARLRYKVELLCEQQHGYGR